MARTKQTARKPIKRASWKPSKKDQQLQRAEVSNILDVDDSLQFRNKQLSRRPKTPRSAVNSLSVDEFAALWRRKISTEQIIFPWGRAACR
jgi:hypothetical protein